MTILQDSQVNGHKFLQCFAISPARARSWCDVTMSPASTGQKKILPMVIMLGTVHTREASCIVIFIVNIIVIIQQADDDWVITQLTRHHWMWPMHRQPFAVVCSARASEKWLIYIFIIIDILVACQNLEDCSARITITSLISINTTGDIVHLNTHPYHNCSSLTVHECEIIIYIYILYICVCI